MKLQCNKHKELREERVEADEAGVRTMLMVSRSMSATCRRLGSSLRQSHNDGMGVYLRALVTSNSSASPTYAMPVPIVKIFIAWKSDATRVCVCAIR